MLYDFSELKIFVKGFGIDPDSRGSRFTITVTEKLTAEELDKYVEITNTGIFYTDKKGLRHKGFLFIQKGYSDANVQRFGTSVPKFHVINCKTIEEQKQRLNFNGHYVFSNSQIKMIDKFDNVEKEPTVCGNCLGLVIGLQKNMKTSEYRDQIISDNKAQGNFEESDLPIDIPTNRWGYTHDWDETSKNYRMKKFFTCEQCGINLNQNLVDGYYLETHHLDGNKKNNLEDNLKCLCVLCHSNFDAIHKENYKKQPNSQKLIDFVQLFYDRLVKIKNPYIAAYKR